MSEMKAVHAFDVYEEYIKTGDDDAAQVYIKSEADKVIAELKEKQKNEVKELLCLIRDKENNFNRAFDSEEKEIRHQKKKRCLRNAEGCLNKAWYYVEVHDRNASNRMWKWRQRWIAIAEKFKTNSTAQ
ncbi:hypothetical protein [Fibrobacter succinogenes]|uniref:hypothetical protein n=1 Tax=Fibrobacter succinogenes TaxID=833 RepID=UPI001569C451|nr:hypothetical protein [Fibrobacter succinogenes]